MTVTSTTNRVREQGNGSKTAFDFSFKVFAATDLEVYKVVRSTGAETLQTITTDYTVTLTDNGDSGGTVTYTVAPTALEDSLIIRTLTIDQQFDIPVASNLPEVQLENGYDKLTMIDQQLQEQIDRALVQAVGSTVTGVSIPTPTANKAIIWNSAGDNLINSTDDYEDQLANVTAQATAASNSASAASTSAGNAATSESNAATSAAEAAASAAGVNLPSAGPTDTGAILQVNAAGTGYQLLTPGTARQVLTSNGSDALLSYTDAGFVLLSTQTASASTSIDFTSGIDNTFNYYMLILTNVVPTTDDTPFFMRVSQSSTFQSGASDYQWADKGLNVDLAGGLQTNNDVSDSELEISGSVNCGNDTGEGYNAVIHIPNPSSSTVYKIIRWYTSFTSSSGTERMSEGFGNFQTNTSAIDGVQFLFSSGTVSSGTFKLYGVS